MLLYSTDCPKRNSKMKNKEQHTFPFIERLLDGAEVEWRVIGEVAEIYGGLTGKTKSDFEDGNALFVSYKNIYDNYEVKEEELDKVRISEGEKQNKVEYGDILFTGSSETAEEVAFSSAVTTHFQEAVYLNSFSFGVRFHKDTVLIPQFSKHLFRGLSMRKQLVRTASGVTRFNVSKVRFKKLLIPIPPIHTQQRIVDILDKFTELEAELEGRKRQYEYYRNQLLSIDVLSKGMQNTDKIPIRTMGEIGEFIRGKRFVKTDITTQGCPCIHYGEMYTHYGIWANKSKSFISPALVTQKNLRLAQTNDVIIVGAGETIEDLGVGTAWLSQTSVVIHDACFIFRSNLNPKYVAYFTRTNNFHDQLRRHVSSGKISAVNAKGLAKIQIPIPPLSEQQRIVSILDKFDTLTTSISEGLPKEIELRRKQYEYYRDRLLSFKH